MLLLLLMLPQCYGKNIDTRLRAAVVKKSVTTRTAMVIDSISSFSTEKIIKPSTNSFNNPFSCSSSYISDTNRISSSMYRNSDDDIDKISNNTRSNERNERKVKSDSNSDNNSKKKEFLNSVLTFFLTIMIIFNPSTVFAIPTQPLAATTSTLKPTTASLFSLPISTSSIPISLPSPGGFTIPPPQPQFNAPSGIRESIAKSAANIPGNIIVVRYHYSRYLLKSILYINTQMHIFIHVHKSSSLL